MLDPARVRLERIAGTTLLIKNCAKIGQNRQFQGIDMS